VSGAPITTSTPEKLDLMLALALSRPTEALAQAKALLAADPSAGEAAVAHQTAGLVLRDFGDVEESLVQLQEARKCARRCGDLDREADILSTYGSALVMAGHTRRGLQALDTAINKRKGPPDGRFLIRKAHVLWLLGRNQEALSNAQRAVTALQDGDLVWQARAFSHRAMAYQAIGAVARADEDYVRCEELFAKAGQQLEFAAARQDRGAAAFARGDLPTALAHLDTAQHLIDDLGVFEPELFVTRSSVLVAAGLFRDALQVADDAILRSEHQRGAAVRRGELFLAAASAAYSCGDPFTAIRRSTDALAMFRRQQRPWWAARAELVLLLSNFRTGERTPSLLRRSGRLAEQLEGIDQHRSVQAHLLAGQVALDLGRKAAAGAHLESASRKTSRDLGVRTVGWLARAVLSEAQGRTEQMLTACARGLDVIDIQLRTLGATELRAHATAQGSQLSRMALRHAVQSGDPRRVLLWSERWRATALAVPPVRLDEDPSMMSDLSALRALTRRLEEHQDGAPAVNRSPLEQERRRLENSVRQRALRQPGENGGRRARLRIEDLQAQLGESRLIELTDVDGDLYAVVVGGPKPRLIRVGLTSVAERALAHALFALRREAGRRGEQPLDLAVIGARLQTALLGPAAEQVQDRPVVIVPTGRLHAVPWALMPQLRDLPVTVAPSAATWLRGRRAQPPQERRVVLIGGPELSSGAQEVRSLAKECYPQAVVLTEGTATTDRVLAAMDGAWLVHVAAHGTFRADSPLLSSLRLDDGPLTVYDLERLKQAPHRVVLSSCNSAVGAPSGADELLGLVSALISLGSCGVIASVVPVDDPATVPLMLALHHRLPDASPAEALAGARRAVRDDPRARCAADSFVALGA
jgi:CHAT domain-containing protein/tetratricopeptide (TPR) repeat protein